jgi:hypothetical protein
MEPEENRSFNSLVEQYLGASLPGRLADNISFPKISAETREIILRMFALMKPGTFPAKDGYTDGAVKALSLAGYQAWRNPMGDIAVLPLNGSLPVI